MIKMKIDLETSVTPSGVIIGIQEGEESRKEAENLFE